MKLLDKPRARMKADCALQSALTKWQNTRRFGGDTEEDWKKLQEACKLVMEIK